MAGLKWRKGPAQLPEDVRPEVFDGDCFLVAIWARDGRDPRKMFWEYSLIRITEHGSETIEGDPWGWSWDCVDWYVPVGELTPPDPDA